LPPLVGLIIISQSLLTGLLQISVYDHKTELLEKRVIKNKHIRAVIGVLFFLSRCLLVFCPAVIYSGSFVYADYVTSIFIDVYCNRILPCLAPMMLFLGVDYAQLLYQTPTRVCLLLTHGNLSGGVF